MLDPQYIGEEEYLSEVNSRFAWEKAAIESDAITASIDDESLINTDDDNE